MGIASTPSLGLSTNANGGLVGPIPFWDEGRNVPSPQPGSVVTGADGAKYILAKATGVIPPNTNVVLTEPAMTVAAGAGDWYSQTSAIPINNYAWFRASIQGGGVLPSLYLGQMATGCNYNNSQLGAVAGRKVSGRTMHYTYEDIVDPKVVWASWSVNSANVETNSTGGKIKCAVELTLGTRTAQNTEGLVTYSNGYAVCTFPGLTIPKNTFFWIDHYEECDNGTGFYGLPADGYHSSEGWAFGTSVTDYTISGTPPKAFLGGQGKRPIMILGQTRAPSFVLLGTSRTYGIANWASVSAGSFAALGPVARLIGKRFGYTSMGNASSRLATFLSNSRTFRDQMLNGTIDGINTGVPYHSHMINYDMTNDLGSGGDTAAAAVARLETLNSTYPKHIHIDQTVVPNTTTTNGWTTKAAQTPTTSGAKSLTANDLIRAKLVGSAGYIDFADAIDPTRLGKFAVALDVTAESTPQASYTASISGQVMTVTAGSGGAIVPGQGIIGSGVSVGQQVKSQLTGTAGGVGTYAVAVDQTLASSALTSGGFGTQDGLHENNAMTQVMADSLEAVLDQMKRAA
jgi:hypothetical protein